MENIKGSIPQDEQYREQLAQVEQELDQCRQALEETNQQQLDIGIHSEAAALSTAAQDKELERLQASRDALVEELAQCKKEEAALHIDISERALKLDAEQKRKREELDRRISELNAFLERSRARADISTVTCEESLAAFNLARDKAVQQGQETAAAHQALNDDFASIRSQLNNVVKEAAVKRSVSHIEQEAAEAAFRLAEKSYAEINDALSDAVGEIEERQATLDRLCTEKEQELEEISRRCQQAGEEARVEEQTAESEYRTCKQEATKAQRLAKLSQDSLASTEERSSRLSAELQELYQETEREAAAVSARMEEALRTAMAERDHYAEIQNLAHDISLQANAAEEEERRITDLVSSLRTEAQDLRNAAMVAKNLATDATAARGNASMDMLGALSEMERAMIASASDAEQQFLNKEAQLQEAENQLARANAEARKIRFGAMEAQRRVNDAEQTSVKAEQTLLDLSAQVERRNSTRSSQLINSKQAAFDQAAKEAAELKAAASSTANSLRAAKIEMEKAEQRLVAASRKAAGLAAAREKEICVCEERFDARIAEARALLEIAKDKQNKLSDLRSRKDQALTQARNQMELKRTACEAMQSNYDRLNQEVELRLSESKAKMDATVAADNKSCEEANMRATAANRSYDMVLLESMKISDEILQGQEELAQQKQEREKLTELQRNEKETNDNIGLLQSQQKAESSRELEKRLAALDNPLALAQLGLEQAGKEQARLKAAWELAELRRVNTLERIAFLEREQQRVSNEQAVYLAEEAEKARQAELRAEALRRQKAEAERRADIIAGAKLVMSQDMAHIHTEAVQAREEAARYTQLLAEQGRVVEMAAGQMLPPDENLALVDSGRILERVQSAKELIRSQQEPIAWNGPEEAIALFAEADQQARSAEEHQRLFRAAQATYNSLKTQVAEKQEHRRELGRELAAAISRYDKASHEELHMQRSDKELRAALEICSEANRELLKKAARHIAKAARDSHVAVEEQTQLMDELNNKITGAEADAQDIRARLKESQSLLHEVSVTWINAELTAMRAKAQAEAIQNDAAFTQEVAALAASRVSAAREAATPPAPSAESGKAHTGGKQPRKTPPRRNRR